MAKTSFDEQACKGCGLCVTVCPKKIISLTETINHKGYPYARIQRMEECTGCASCALICPDCVITVER